MKNECDSQLIEYARTNDIAGASALLESGCDTNVKKEIGFNTWTCPLRSGIHHPNPEMAELLLSAGANPNLDNGCGMTPFHYSAGGSQLESFKLLLDHGGNVNELNLGANYPTPLIWAISGDKIENVKLLIESGAEIEPAEINGFNPPLHKAISYKNFEIAEYLLQQGTNPNSKFTDQYGDCYSCPIDISPIHEIAYFYDDSLAIKFVELLCEFKADLNAKNKQGYNVLAYIAPEVSPTLARFLISKGVEVTDASVYRAVRNNNIELLEILLRNGGNPNAVMYGQSVMKMAASDDRIMTILLKHGGNQNK